MKTATTKPRRATCTITQEEYEAHANDYDGFCTACGEWTCGGCEPDARRYLCEGCDERAVYGAEEALMRGLISFCGE